MNQSAATLPSPVIPEIESVCFHCGETCERDAVRARDKTFCCIGCQTVYEILQDNNLCTDFDERAKLSFKQAKASRFEYLDDEAVRRALVQFSDGTMAKTTFRLPQIHCVSCIWLLENLFKINPAILRSEVNFLTKEIALATTVLLYSASDYFVSSWFAFRQRNISLDVPVALGLSALYFRSLYDIFSGISTGYLDSFTGLVFFLLIGKLFQKKTFDALSFERNYAAYFPLSVTLLKGGSERSVPVSKLQPGDEIFVRNRELVPADSVLQSAQALMDYSFVTGESAAVEVKRGDIVYAGGRVVGTGATLVVTKEVSHSYLTQLWNHEAFRKEKRSSLVDVSDAFGKYFTVLARRFQPKFGVAQAEEKPGEPGCLISRQPLPSRERLG